MTARPNATILYHSDGFDTSRPNLMGRHAAGEGMLAGFVRHGGVGSFECYAASAAMAQEFASKVGAFGGNGRPVGWVPYQDPRGIGRTGTLMIADPDLATTAWRRRAADPTGYSLCGITHTTASAGAMDSITGLLTAPVEPWDALICTSAAVRDTVTHLWDNQADYLVTRLGAQRFPLPRLAVIPLGVDTDRFLPNPALRAQWRGRLGLAEDEVAVLFVGRLSFHAKANPYPLMAACQRVAVAAGRRIGLVMAGWFANDSIEAAFKAAAATLCPDVAVRFIDGRDPGVRSQIWQAADIFASPADCIQETFGLTPVEAMASGLPVVVSDWDGYRDSVRDGVDGFRVPTLAPSAPLGGDFADRYAVGLDTYDHYCANTGMLVAVDPEAFTERLQRLVVDRDLRQRMGFSARARAASEFDWRIIIGRYQALWTELAEVRRLQTSSAPRNPARPHWPRRPDPYAAFASYSTRRLSATDRLRVPASAPDYGRLVELALFAWAKPLIPTPEEYQTLVARIGDGTATVGDLVADVPDARRPLLVRGLVALVKMGLLALADPA